MIIIFDMIGVKVEWNVVRPSFFQKHFPHTSGTTIMGNLY